MWLTYSFEQVFIYQIDAAASRADRPRQCLSLTRNVTHGHRKHAVDSFFVPLLVRFGKELPRRLAVGLLALGPDVALAEIRVTAVNQTYWLSIANRQVSLSKTLAGTT